MNIPDQTLTIEPFTEADIPELTGVMQRAFDEDARGRQGKPRGGPPGYDNGDFFRQWLFGYSETVGFKALSGGRAAGAIIAWVLPGDRNIIGTVFVDPAFHRQGIGARLIQFVEAAYPQTLTWSLATPTWSTRNHRFYEALGYRQVESDPIVPKEPDMLIYRKDCRAE